MTNTITPDATKPYVLASNEGRYTHFLNHLATTKVSPGRRRFHDRGPVRRAAGDSAHPSTVTTTRTSSSS